MISAREPLNRFVLDPNRPLEKDPKVERPEREPAKDELPKVEREPLKPAPPRIDPDREVCPAPKAAPDDAPLDGPKLCQPVPTPPPLRAEKLEPAKFPELRPPLKRAELPALPNECQCPSLIAE